MREWLSSSYIAVLLNICCTILLVTIAKITYVLGFENLIDKILPFDRMVLFIFGFVGNQISLCIAAMLRSYKKEDFAAISVVGAILTIAGVFYLGRVYGVVGVGVTMLGVSVLGFFYSSSKILKLISIRAESFKD